MIGVMTKSDIERVRELEAVGRTLEQVPIKTSHVLHAGMYARTLEIPAGVVVTGVLVKVATLLVISGEAELYVGNSEMVRLVGNGMVLTGNAGRKQFIVTLKETHVTMIFPTNAKTVEEAENEFTDEGDLLLSRNEPGMNHILITEA